MQACAELGQGASGPQVAALTGSLAQGFSARDDQGHGRMHAFWPITNFGIAQCFPDRMPAAGPGQDLPRVMACVRGESLASARSSTRLRAGEPAAYEEARTAPGDMAPEELVAYWARRRVLPHVAS